jgi:myo-inositol-1(or 4)-monophosphatase
MAAGTLLVREAGGLVTDFAGAPASIRGKQVLASNGIIHEAMLRVVQASVPR